MKLDITSKDAIQKSAYIEKEKMKHEELNIG